MAEFGTFSLKDAIAPALQVQQMRMQEAETQGVLAKLAREREMQAQRQNILKQYAGSPDEASEALVAAGDLDAAKAVAELGGRKEKKAADAFDRWNSALTTMSSLLGKVSDAADPDLAYSLVRPGMLGLFERLNPGQDVSTLLPEKFDAAALSSASTEVEKLAKALGRARKSGNAELAGALEQRLGVLTSREPDSYVTVYKDGSAVGSFPKGDPRLTEFQGQPGVIIGSAAAQGTLADIGAPDKTEMRAIRTQIRNSEGNIEELDKALAGVESTPEATGVRGLVIEKLGGLLGQLPVIGPETTNMLGTPEVQAVRTRLQSILGRFIGAITGDTSGRYSNRDLQLAQTAAQATNPTASYEQVVSALKTLREIEVGALERNRSALGGAAPQTPGIPIPDSLKDTPDGSEIRNNSTGKVYVRRGNRLIEK